MTYTKLRAYAISNWSQYTQISLSSIKLSLLIQGVKENCLFLQNEDMTTCDILSMFKGHWKHSCSNPGPFFFSQRKSYYGIWELTTWACAMIKNISDKQLIKVNSAECPEHRIQSVWLNFHIYIYISEISLLVDKRSMHQMFAPTPLVIFAHNFAKLDQPFYIWRRLEVLHLIYLENA